MAPEFRAGRYGAGLLAGTERIIGRIAQGRGVTLDGVRAPPSRSARERRHAIAMSTVFVLALHRRF